jgi:hypothetical protein
MARTNVVAQTCPGAYPALPITPDARDITWLGANVSDKNDTALVAGKTLVLARNVDSGAHTVSFTSVADSLNRKGDITTYSVGADQVALFGPFTTIGWASGGRLLFEGDNINIEFAVITLP